MSTDTRGQASEPRATLLYDAPCGLCHASVRWLRERDHGDRLQFVPLDSVEGVELLRAFGFEPEHVESVVLIHGECAWQRSDAMLESLRLLGGPWSLAVAARIIPRVVRDAAYRLVARHRHVWFARADACGWTAPGAPRD